MSAITQPSLIIRVKRKSLCLLMADLDYPQSCCPMPQIGDALLAIVKCQIVDGCRAFSDRQVDHRRRVLPLQTRENSGLHQYARCIWSLDEIKKPFLLRKESKPFSGLLKAEGEQRNAKEIL